MRSFLRSTRLFAVVLALFMAAVPAIDSLGSSVRFEVDGKEKVDDSLDQKASSPAPVSGRSSLSRRCGSRRLSRVALLRAACATPRHPSAPPLSPARDPVQLSRPLRC